MFSVSTFQQFNISTFQFFQHFNSSTCFNISTFSKSTFQHVQPWPVFNSGFALNRESRNVETYWSVGMLKCWKVSTLNTCWNVIQSLYDFQHVNFQHFNISTFAKFQYFNISTCSTFQPWGFRIFSAPPNTPCYDLLATSCILLQAGCLLPAPRTHPVTLPWPDHVLWSLESLASQPAPGSDSEPTPSPSPDHVLWIPEPPASQPASQEASRGAGGRGEAFDR